MARSLSTPVAGVTVAIKPFLYTACPLKGWIGDLWNTRNQESSLSVVIAIAVFIVTVHESPGVWVIVRPQEIHYEPEEQQVASGMRPAVRKSTTASIGAVKGVTGRLDYWTVCVSLHLLQRNEIVAWCAKYLRTIRENDRIGEIHTGCEHGFIEGAKLIFKVKTKSIEYNDEINSNTFMKWPLLSIP
ncbi:hypothetical protein PR048_021052 [Dryococelus australis]|uniref:Uncharacterized protein n=1 Tax=Dryococelus australis TaxID=614101 RepID=A0ABQ9GX66_9NEOP|nr:hypothetical protein PR048_021052 [Dryococelus australis]